MTREAASEKPFELFFLSRTSEFNIDAATDDLLACEPRLVSLLSEECCCVPNKSSCKSRVVSVCPELMALEMRPFGVADKETRLGREGLGLPKAEGPRDECNEAGDDFRHLSSGDCGIGKGRPGN